MASQAQDLPDETAPIQFGLPILALMAALAFALSGAGSHTVWYVVRATGVVSYALVTLTVVCGLLVSNRAMASGRPRVDVYEVHRFLALVAISAAGFHAVTLLLDSYIGFSPVQIVVPFTSAYRPLAVAFGIMALYGAVAVYASFYVKKWIGYRTWRALHYGSFVVFALASYHGILSGADSGQAWMLAVYGAAIITVMALVVYRIIRVSETEAAKTERVVTPVNTSRAAAPQQRYGLPPDETAWRPPARQAPSAD
ncbi:MAG TPA: ferric reductase-like transmembrane domain-containing protein [Dehalococcoidia bacterium]|jgi:predicted ferric reductase